MDIRCIGEDVHDFVDDVLGELQGLLVASAKHFPEYAELGGHFIRAARAAQFGIGSQCGKHVTRHVHFRNNGDEALGGIGHDFLGLFLCVEAADGCAIELAGAGSRDGLLAHGADFRQFGIFLDFDAPALVFRQMPVENVDIVEGHHVNQFLQVVHREEMTAHVNHKATVAVLREVLHRTCGQCAQCFTVRDGQRLVDGLHAIEYASLSLSVQGHLVGSDVQHIAFLLRDGGIQAQYDAIFVTGLRTEFHFCARHLFYIRSQEMSRPLQFLVSGGIANLGGRAHYERFGRLRLCDFLW